MEYFFILGRNPGLSRAELLMYLEARGIMYKELSFEENIIILKLDREFSFNVQNFGGIIGIGILRKFSNIDKMLEFLEKNEFIELDRFNYSVIGNVDSHIFSEKFKQERKKARIKNSGKKLKFQSGDSFFLPSVDIGIFAKQVDSDFYLGLIEQKFNPREVEIRDMGKPFRRESLAISPRLARILINLSGAKEGDLILDPFCGVGGIIQEAVLMGINTEGIDKDSSAINGATQNLRWLKNNFNVSGNYKIFNKDSLKAENKQFDAVVAESSLGELLKRKLNDKSARKYLEEFKKQIIPLLKHFRKIKKNNARIAITFPCFDRAEILRDEISESTGLRIYSSDFVKFPIIEKRKNQFVNRQIWLFH